MLEVLARGSMKLPLALIMHQLHAWTTGSESLDAAGSGCIIYGGWVA